MKRILPLFLLAAGSSLAAPAVATVADTLYNNDGSAFNGTVQIQGFIRTQGGAQILQSLQTLRITSGALSVQLVPNSSTTPYVFTYSSGAIQYCVFSSATTYTLAGNCTAQPSQNSQALGSILVSQLASPGEGTSCLKGVNGTTEWASCLATAGTTGQAQTANGSGGFGPPLAVSQSGAESALVQTDSAGTVAAGLGNIQSGYDALGVGGGGYIGPFLSFGYDYFLSQNMTSSAGWYIQALPGTESLGPDGELDIVFQDSSGYTVYPLSFDPDGNGGVTVSASGVWTFGGPAEFNALTAGWLATSAIYGGSLNTSTASLCPSTTLAGCAKFSAAVNTQSETATITTVNGSTTATVTSSGGAASIVSYSVVVASGIPSGTLATAINTSTNQITLSRAATASATGVAATFYTGQQYDQLAEIITAPADTVTGYFNPVLRLSVTNSGSATSLYEIGSEGNLVGGSITKYRQYDWDFRTPGVAQGWISVSNDSGGNGIHVTLLSGISFQTSWTGSITIGSTNYTIASVTDSSHLVLSTAAPTSTGELYSYVIDSGGRSIWHIDSSNPHLLVFDCDSPTYPTWGSCTELQSQYITAGQTLIVGSTTQLQNPANSLYSAASVYGTAEVSTALVVDANVTNPAPNMNGTNAFAAFLLSPGSYATTINSNTYSAGSIEGANRGFRVNGSGNIGNLFGDAPGVIYYGTGVVGPAQAVSTYVELDGPGVGYSCAATITVSGGSSTMTCTASPSGFTLSALGSIPFLVTPGSNNTGATTFNVSGTGAVRVLDSSGNPLTTGELTAGTAYYFSYSASCGGGAACFTFYPYSVGAVVSSLYSGYFDSWGGDFTLVGDVATIIAGDFGQDCGCTITIKGLLAGYIGSDMTLGTWQSQIYTNQHSASNSYAMYHAGAAKSYLAGNLGILTTNPPSPLTVGASNQFQVSSTGAITAATGITSSGSIVFSGISASSGDTGSMLALDSSGSGKVVSHAYPTGTWTPFSSNTSVTAANVLSSQWKPAEAIVLKSWFIRLISAENASCTTHATVVLKNGSTVIATQTLASSTYEYLTPSSGFPLTIAAGADLQLFIGTASSGTSCTAASGFAQTLEYQVQ
jgi:hypothetical protein